MAKKPTVSVKPCRAKVPKLISVNEAAEILGSSPQAVFKMIYRRQLHSTKLGTSQTSPRRVHPPPDHRPVTKDELELVLRGLLIPSQEMVHRMAYQLWGILGVPKWGNLDNQG